MSTDSEVQSRVNIGMDPTESVGLQMTLAADMYSRLQRWASIDH